MLDLPEQLSACATERIVGLNPALCIVSTRALML